MAAECSRCYDPIKGSGGLCFYCQCLQNDDIMVYLRGIIKRWVRDSRNYWDDRCVVTGKKSTTVHHVTNFAGIVHDALDELRLPKKPVTWYKAQELKDLELLVLIKHYEAGLGVCLSRPLHDDYHTKYGKRNNTKAQFEIWYEDIMKGVK